MTPETVSDSTMSPGSGLTVSAIELLTPEPSAAVAVISALPWPTGLTTP